MHARPRARALGLLVAAGALAVPAALGVPATASPTTADDALTPRAAAPAPVAAAVVTPRFDAAEVALMARTSGRTVAQQEALLERQAASNNTLARLRAAGHDFDGEFLDGSGRLVVRAASASADARAARAAGAVVAPAAHGEEELRALQDRFAAADLTGVSSLEVDLPGDRLVVGRSGATSPEVEALVARHADAVRVVETPALSAQLTVRGGDAVYTSSGGRCSAGFPARDSAGARYMIWAGHCNEGGGSFTSGGSRIGVSAGSAFTSYDGLPDRDIGALRIDAEDTVARTVNPYGSGRNLDALSGASKPAVGTQLCKSGSTTGVTCGQVASYGNTVTYSDAQGRTVAQVSGLMRSTVCTEGGDSGGTYTAGGYAVGLTSGGPSTQRCTYNGGFESGKSSYVQPVTDALAYYGLTYG
ncbi:S1 family peptidase [Nocardioides sp. ChNu-153]|uniref:S1 family peptidase n=1 Tax=unclassified Nocardioides TaxID=2615069 RepID=UPI0024076E47|nr:MULTISPECIES: S1 family peptidase [unclassified Nocardioides]MDF9717081.1 S1 family peptidase [Nocardioides sp. ChNu-99]MDN7121510.1 S1 family peptidase [Nocardioides sp. ChNu-153]